MRTARWSLLVVMLVLLATPRGAVAQSVDEFFQQGNAAQSAGRFPEAESIWRQVLQSDPSNPFAYNNLGNALSDQGKLDEAIAAYRQAIQLDPKYVNPYYGLGIALRAQGKLDEAIAAYRQAIQLDPKDAFPYNGLGIALRAQGKLDEAIAAYRQAIQLDPKDAFPYNGLGNALRAQGKLDEAIAAYRQALSRPDAKGTPISAHTAAHNNLGYALQQQNNLTEAIAEYKKSIALDPNVATATNNLREAQRLLALQRNPQPTVADDRKYLPSITEEPLVSVLRSTARIIVQTSGGTSNGPKIGTGWVVKRDGNEVWVVTNRHVILSDQQTSRPSTAIEVEFFSDLPPEKRPRYTAVVEHISEPNEELDLAVLRITGVPSDIQPLKVSTGRISRNTPVRVIGHPYTVDDPWNSSSGEISNYNPNPNNIWLPVDAYVAEGNSGGPVVNDQLQVIAMMVRIRGSRDIANDPNQPPPPLQDADPATGEVVLAYRIDIVMEKLRSWRILN